MNLTKFYELLELPESEFLDFKISYATDNGDTVHDILCLANSNTSFDRYLIFGVQDKTKTIVGVETDPNRKSQADFMNILYNSKFNRIPQVSLKSLEVEGHSIDVLTVRNLPEKPYFLTKDYRAGKRFLRTGVIYTRNGDTNTPMDGTADDLQIEKMFRERFGIDKSPLERAHIYLKDVDNWAYGHNESKLYFYYKPFPEFTLSVVSDDESFDEPWVHEFPDDKASRDELYLRYHSTRLESVYVVWCDGARLAVAMPHQKVIYPTYEGDLKNCYVSYYYVRNSLKYLVREMIDHVYPQNSRLYFDGITAVFDSEVEAEEELKKDFAAGVKKYAFYTFDHDEGDDFRIDSSGKQKLFRRRNSQQ